MYLWVIKFGPEITKRTEKHLRRASVEVEAAWRAERRMTRGGQPIYSDLAITIGLTLGMVFKQS